MRQGMRTTEGQAQMATQRADLAARVSGHRAACQCEDCWAAFEWRLRVQGPGLFLALNPANGRAKFVTRSFLPFQRDYLLLGAAGALVWNEHRNRWCTVGDLAVPGFRAAMCGKGQFAAAIEAYADGLDGTAAIAAQEV